MSPKNIFNTYVHDKFTRGNAYIHAHESVDINGEMQPLISVLYQLWDDESKMPTTLCGMLDMPVNSTYAQAVRKLAKKV